MCPSVLSLYSLQIDGFQFRDGPFVLKRIVIHSVQAGSPAVYTFETVFPLEEPYDALQTYRYATRNIHGLPVSLPGLPYDSRHEAVSAYFRYKAFQFLEQSGSFGADNGPFIMILVKGSQKIPLLRDLIDSTGVLERVEVHNLEDYGCPTAHALTGCRSSTTGRAAMICAWLRGRYHESIPHSHAANALPR